MKLRSIAGQAITIPLGDGAEWTITSEGTEIDDEVGEMLLLKCPDQLEKIEEVG